jgi:hypothetical protein
LRSRHPRHLPWNAFRRCGRRIRDSCRHITFHKYRFMSFSLSFAYITVNTSADSEYLCGPCDQPVGCFLYFHE